MEALDSFVDIQFGRPATRTLIQTGIMAKQNTKPALYELLKTEQPGDQPPPLREEEPEQAHVVEDEVSHRPGWLTPGRAIQIPVGYAFVALAAFVIAVAGGYILGYMRGETVGEAATEEMLAATDPASRGLGGDPLVDQHGGGGNNDPEKSSAASTGDQTSSSGEQRTWGAIKSDPRQPDKHYFILATPPLDGAIRLAEFCRDHGLETYVVTGNNARLPQVIALPGFTDQQMKADADQAIREKIRRIGNMWKLKGGTTNLGDHYAVRYRGNG